MKKLLLVSLAVACASGAAFAEYTGGTAAIVGDFKNKGYSLSIEWGSDAMLGNANVRAGIGYGDHFYMIDNVANTISVYGQFGFVKDISVAAAPFNTKGWVSATADDAGHVLLRCADAGWYGSGAYAGAYYPQDGHNLIVIDGATQQPIGQVRMNDGTPGRYDALGHVHGDVTAGYWDLITTNDSGVGEDYIFDGIEVGNVGVESFQAPIHSDFANSGAGAAKTTGSAQIFGDLDEDGFYTKMAFYSNPVIGITGFNTAKALGNGIRLFEYAYDEDGVQAWRPTDKFFVTPQHSSNNGFIIFNLQGTDYIAYVSGEGAGGAEGANMPCSADAIAIAEVSYTDTPVSNPEKDDATLVARLYGQLNEAEAQQYLIKSNFTCFNIEDVPGDDCSKYIYIFCQQSPMVKLKFTVPASSSVNNVAVDNNNAPVEYFNLQGVRIAEPQNGIFIRRQGDKATKVIR
ncbi:MAG: hypothetical protein J1E63_09120 [Muribaculaceae bacterium]|nr:hypothetical protein [Muribaculaceae bacterium]